MNSIFKILALIFFFQTLTLTLTAQTETNLRFYFHDIVSGLNPTAIRVAQPSPLSTSLTGFGDMIMIDDPLTSGPDLSSDLVGRAQGIYAFASRDETGHLLMAMNLVFLDKENNGSTISVFGRNSVYDEIREMPIVGGTGKFRMAQGYAHAKTHTFDQMTGDTVVEYNVTVFH